MYVFRLHTLIISHVRPSLWTPTNCFFFLPLRAILVFHMGMLLLWFQHQWYPDLFVCWCIDHSTAQWKLKVSVRLGSLEYFCISNDNHSLKESSGFHNYSYYCNKWIPLNLKQFVCCWGGGNLRQVDLQAESRKNLIQTHENNFGMSYRKYESRT